MKPLVIDGSMTLGFILKDEHSAQALKTLREIEKGVPSYVPSHWWLETANGLIMAERRKRASLAEVMEALSLLRELPVITDDETAQHCVDATAALARQYALTIYDAAYLELAIRRKSTLATTDRQLAKAAMAAGVAVFQ